MTGARWSLNAGALVLGLALAGVASAQEDPIDALLNKTVPAPAPVTTTPPTPETPPPLPAPAPPPEALPTQRDATPPANLPPPAISTIPPTPPPAAAPAADAPHDAPMPLRPPPSPPPAYVPRSSGLTAPMRLEETGKAPDGPPSPSDLYFESRVRQSFNAAQGMQGPLDGHWVVRAAGAEVFDLQLVDKNQGAVEGAWRDPRRRGAADASGFIDSIQRSGGELNLRFTPHPGDDPVQLALRSSGDSWTGELIERGERRSVTVRRN